MDVTPTEGGVAPDTHTQEQFNRLPPEARARYEGLMAELEADDPIATSFQPLAVISMKFTSILGFIGLLLDPSIQEDVEARNELILAAQKAATIGRELTRSIASAKTE